MEWDSIEGDWKQVSARMKEKWTSLTDDDLQFVDRNKGALIAKVRDRTGLARDTVERQLDALIAGLLPTPSAVAKPPVPPAAPPPSGAKPG
ncbi:MAG: hypothetical protein ACXWLM_07240 [Myxococcales bacterium]